MAYKTLPKIQLSRTIRKWMKKNEVIAPQKIQDSLKYEVVADSDAVVLNHSENTVYPPKAFFLPQSETLFVCQPGQYQAPVLASRQRILLGVRPCDARAFWLLDHVFKEKGAEDLYWSNRRERSLVFSMGCDTPCDTCFCTAVGGSPFGKEGVDVQITSMGDDYLFEAVTKRGQALIDDLPQAEPGQVTKLKQVQNQSIAGMQKPFDSTGLRDHLYAMFEDKYWREVSQSCLGCGVCTFLCPSCFCFDIVDEVLRDERVRNWDTCMFRVYSLEASGHNPRPTKAERTRQRVMHKFAYWVDLVDGFGCTGCGRCVINCPVNLDIRQMVRGAQAVKVKAEVGK